MEIQGSWLFLTVELVLMGLISLVAFRFYRLLSRERFRNKSLSTKYGKLTEQFLPLVESYPWDPGNFRFLGSPIDGVQFDDEKIILVEFKSGNSQLSSRQRKIRDLVKNHKVEFEVIKISV